MSSIDIIYDDRKDLPHDSQTSHVYQNLSRRNIS